ncbi:hypothetical protein Q3G72_004871 [Acer saccharum]|nr:hypothetical protein Q3G72_004871 [Acer saccharum]
MTIGDDNNDDHSISKPNATNSTLEHEDRQQEGEEEDKLLSKTWKESTKLWEIAGPSIFSRLAMFSMTVITQTFTGHLSDLDLAAISRKIG